VSHRDNVEALADSLRRDVDGDALDALASFATMVESWNRKMNLTAAREPIALCEVLFADALMLADEKLIPECARVLDVGSGAGAPAIPVAILRPDATFVLVEPIHKRVAFMRHAIGSLGLGERMTVLERKLEPDDIALPGAPFDVAMSRATLAPEDWLSLGSMHARRVLVLTAKDDLADGGPESIQADAGSYYTIPSSGADRWIWVHQRTEH